jgi:hypothetical protein
MWQKPVGGCLGVREHEAGKERWSEEKRLKPFRVGDCPGWFPNLGTQISPARAVIGSLSVGRG